MPTIDLLYNTSEGHQKLAQAIQQMWKTTLGIDVTLTNTDWKVYLSRQSIGDFQIARAGWIGDYIDPKSFLDMMVTGRGNNQTGWSNKEYDNLLVKASNSTSQQERFNYFYEAEKILIDEMPIIPIYTYTRIYMLHEDVQGWGNNILDSRPYQFVYLENKKLILFNLILQDYLRQYPFYSRLLQLPLLWCIPHQVVHLMKIKQYHQKF